MGGDQRALTHPEAALYDSLRAAFGGCSHAQRLRALVLREVPRRGGGREYYPSVSLFG